MSFDPSRFQLKFALAGLVCLVAAPIAQAATLDLENFFDATPGGSYSSDLSAETALDPEVANLLESAQKLFLNNDFEAAAPLAKEITERAPGAAAGWHLYGLVLANQERFEEAIAALGTAGELYTLNAEPFIVQGDILLYLGRPDEARAAFEAASARDPSNWRGVETAAILAENEGDVEEAIALYQTAIEAAPQNRLFPRIRAARLLIGEERTAEAVTLLSAFVREAPEDLRALLALGSAQLADGDPQAAIETFETLLAASPDNATALMFLGKSRLLVGEAEPAETALLRARDLDPDSPRIYFELGNFYGAVRDYDTALGMYESGIELLDTAPQLLRGARMAAYRLDRPSTALDYAQRAVDVPGAEAGDFFWLGFLKEQAGDDAGATRAYETALERDPSNWVAANNLAVLLTPVDPDRALSIARDAARKAPGSADVKATLGWAAYRSGQLAEARETYEALASADAPKPHHLYRLGVILIEDGDRPAGLERIEAALALDPDFEGAADARARLAE